MKYIVFWILVTVSMAAPRSYKDEFGRSFQDMSMRIETNRDTLSKQFNQIDSARAFIKRAEKLKADPIYPWHVAVGEQYIDSIWMDSVMYLSGWAVGFDSLNSQLRRK